MTTLQRINEAKRFLLMGGVFALGLIGGIWAVIAPFATNWPVREPGTWTHAIWAVVVPGAVLTAVSGAALVVALGFAARNAARARAEGELA